MSVKLILSPKKILDHVFRGVTNGYDPLEVDEFLDQVLSDYQLIENNEVVSKNELLSLKDRIDKLEKENAELSIELHKLKNRLGGIKESDVVTKDNMELLKRIRALEAFIYDHGFNPDTIVNSFDPDNS